MSLKGSVIKRKYRVSKFFDSKGKVVEGVKRLASGGEGVVWETNTSIQGLKQVAKIYKHDSSQNANAIRERTDKLRLLIDYPPVDPNVGSGHVSFAWPQDFVFDARQRVVGFLMPAITEPRTLLSVCNPKRRKLKKLPIDWRYLHTVARNVASVVQALHENRPHGYVLGDIKLENILVNSQALPTIIDIDSFQAYDSSRRKTYNCLVGSPGFTPPELIGKDFKVTQQSSYHDNFRLGVVIYFLLFGEHPFKGAWKGNGDVPDQNKLVQRGIWPHSPLADNLLITTRFSMPLEVLHPQLKEAFLLCFNDGHRDPALRPTAKEWKSRLDVALQSLRQCSRVSSHWHNSLQPGQCYWCDRKAQLKSDIFPKFISLDRLAGYLLKKQWQQADWETKLLLLGAGNRLLDESVVAELEAYLAEIDRLWSDASGGRFGFSAQKQVFLKTGNLTDHYDWQTYQAFGKQVGWWDEPSGWKLYENLALRSSSVGQLPSGHLPFVSRGFSQMPLFTHIASRLK